jgi:hypothetical protein
MKQEVSGRFLPNQQTAGLSGVRNSTGKEQST